jgi:hypothetical protein
MTSGPGCDYGVRAVGPRRVHDERHRTAFWLWRAVVLIAFAALLQASAPVVVGTAGARIYVRWSDDVDATARSRLERELKLRDGRVHEGTTWNYAVDDVSNRQLRTVVTHASVADTHKIDRTRFELAPDAERTPLQGGLVANGDGWVRLLNGISAALAALAIMSSALAAASGRRWPEPVATRLARVNEAADHPLQSTAVASRRVLDAMQRGIPIVDATTAGAFRVAFGALLLAYVALHPVDALWLANPDTVQVTGWMHGIILDFLSPRAWLVDRVWVGALALGAAFTVGVATRWTFPAFVAVFLLWVSVFVAHRGSHTSTAISLALVALLPSRWGDGFSVDGVIAPGRARAAGRQYGYSVWVPMLVLGLCFAAAAWSKVKDGLGWIANGTVAFHFITDSPQALVSWGLWIARSYPLAVGFSLMAVLVEIFVITAAFTRSLRIRAAAGAGAAMLLSGFALFQGVVWPLWWILLLGFLPWEWLRAQPAASGVSLAASRAQIAVIVVLIVQQLVVSGAGAEVAPLFSTYDMYSATYGSREAYDSTRPTTYRLVDVTDGKERVLPCRIDDTFASEFQKLASGESADRAALQSVLQQCTAPVATPRRVALIGDRVRFDWDRGVLVTDRGSTVIGPVALAAQ